MFMYLGILIVFCTISTWFYYYYKNHLKTKCIRNRIRTIKFTSASHRVPINHTNSNYSTTNRSNIDSQLNGSLSPDSGANNEHLLRQRRFAARNLSTQVNYISPNSVYGYAPSSSSLKKEKPKITREFTVKLSPFPTTTYNLSTRFSSSFKVEPNDDVDELPRPSIGKSTLVVRGVEQETPTRVPDFQRTSVKRPMLLADENDADEDIFDLRNKKSKNTIDIDFDDDEDDADDDMDLEIAEISAATVANKPGKTMKRTTNILDNENNFNLPKKKIKNNEIFSSYISSNSGYHQNKRKFSPETSIVTDFRRTKKRSHIEELELMTTNILSDIAERKDVPKSNLTYSQIVSDENVSKPSTSVEQHIDQKKSDEKSPPNEKDSQPMIEETSNDSQTDKNKEEETLYPIPPYIYSVKDHEYDKKKIKNRLNRFLQAVQEANQESEGTKNSAFSIQTPMTPEVVAKEDVNVKFTLPSSSTSLFQPPAAKIDPIVTSNLTNPTPITTTEKSQMNNNDNLTQNNISSTVSNNLGAEVKTPSNTGLGLITNTPPQTSTVSPSIGSQTIATPVPSQNNVTTSFSISLAPKPSLVNVTDSGQSSAIDKSFGFSNQETKASDQSITKTLSLPTTTIPVATTSSFNFGLAPSTTLSTNLISSKVETSKGFEFGSSAMASNNNENDSKKVTFSIPLTSGQSVSGSSNVTETNPIQTTAQLSLPVKPPAVSNAPAMPGQFSFGTLNTSTNSMFFSNAQKSIDVPKANPTASLPTITAASDPNNQILTFAKTTETNSSILPKITAARRVPVTKINEPMSNNQPPASTVPSMFSFGSNQNQSVSNQSQSNSNSLPSFKNLFNAPLTAATTPVVVSSSTLTTGIFSSPGNTFGKLPTSSTTTGFSFKAFPENKSQSITNSTSNPGQDSLFSFPKIDSANQANNTGGSKPTFSFTAAQPATSAFSFGASMQPPSSNSLFNPTQGTSNSNNVTKNNVGFDFTAAASQLKSSATGFNFNPMAPNPSSQATNQSSTSFTFNAPQQPQSTQPFSFNATTTTTSNNNNSNSIFKFGSN